MTDQAMLEIENLHVRVGERDILHDVSLTIPQGEVHTLFGPNGSGKTTLLNTIMGLSGYTVTQGTIRLRGEDITRLPSNERARRGIGIAFQRPPTIHGVRTRDMVRLAAGGRPVDLGALADELDLVDHLDRDINAGFSGGEIKRSELMQLKAQNPSLILLDEPESGVDIENMQLIGHTIAGLLQKDQRYRQRTVAGLIITHTGFILDYVHADRGHVMCRGTITCEGSPLDILQDIRSLGYEECSTCRRKR